MKKIERAACNAKPALHSIPSAHYELNGEIEKRINAVIEQWIYPAPYANPAMLEMFRNRDMTPHHMLVPWAGEFAGKYLTHCVQIYRLKRNKKLADHISWFVKELCALQDKDGYLGPWPKEWRFKPGNPACEWPWDLWGHYHIMIGLLLWYEETGDKLSLKTTCRIADLMCRRFTDGKPESMHSTGCHEMNQAPYHSLLRLYRLTGAKRYLRLAKTIEKEFEIPPAGDYIRIALEGKEFYQSPKPRWESLHPIMGIVEMYYVTGDEKYKKAFEQLWWSMLKGDRHNNGGFTAGEQATGNPYHTGAIETCCTVAWMAMSVEMLKLTGNPVVADELELSLFNSGFGMMSPSGRWVTYNTPMDGEKCASAHTIVFQARAGSPELNCCSVNGPRTLGLTSEWAVMSCDGGLAINYYGPSSTTLKRSSNRIMILQNTKYPETPDIEIKLKLTKSETFPIFLRIPSWSEDTKLYLNGDHIKNVQKGTYHRIERKWKSGDKIRLVLDFRTRIWAAVDAFWAGVDMELDWHLFGPVPRREEDADVKKPPVCTVSPSLEGLADIPDELLANGNVYKPIKVKSKNGIIACRELFPSVKGLPVVFGFAEITSQEAQDAALFFSADWWTAWYLNGEKVYDNHESGGNRGDLLMRLNQVKLHLRKGRNIIAFKLSGGIQKGCWISIGKSLLKGESRNGEYYASIYRGPILLAFDARYQNKKEETVPVFDENALIKLKKVEDNTWLKPWMLFEAKDINGERIRLCDFASAGLAGNKYRSWLKVILHHKPSSSFSPENPQRTFFVKGK